MCSLSLSSVELDSKCKSTEQQAHFTLFVRANVELMFTHFFRIGDNYFIYFAIRMGYKHLKKKLKTIKFEWTVSMLISTTKRYVHIQSISSY